MTDAGKRTLPAPTVRQSGRGLGFYVVFGLVVGGGALCLAASPLRWGPQLGLAAVLWLAMVAADLLPVLLPRGGFATPGSAVNLAAVLLLGPAPAAWLVASAALVAQLGILRRPVERAVFNAALFALCVRAGGLAFSALGGSVGGLHLPRELPALAGAALAYFAVNAAGVSLILGVTQELSPRRVLARNFLSPALAHLGNLALGACAAVVYLRVGVWGLPLFLLPLLAANFGLRRYFEMRRDLLEFVRALAGVIEEVDPYTRQHAARVAEYCTRVARELGVPERDIEDIEYAALLHDLGKVGRQYQSILHKPAGLTREERTVIRFHPDQGADILARVRWLGRAAEYVRCHHERVDGAGYPRGLGADDLPLGARILMVCDAFDAMISQRAYRGALPVPEALAELGRCAGTQFDPAVVEALDRLIAADRLPLPFAAGADGLAPALVAAGGARSAGTGR